MQKLWLNDFEKQINPSTWNVAQDIHAAGGVKTLREVEKHFWVALVEEPVFAKTGDEGFDLDANRRFEVETIITPHKIKAFTCECWGEGRKLICPHIAAVLLKLRQFLEKKAAEKQAKAKATVENENTRFTIQTVLANASPEELNDFVRDYARRDRDFALALKTWFAAGQEDAAAQFKQLLESVVPKIAPGKPLREPDFRRLRKMLDDLETQLESARSQGNFRTVFSLASAVLSKIFPLLDKTEDNRRQALLYFFKKSLDALLKLENENLSPELRESVWKLVFDTGEKLLFPKEAERDLLKYFSENALDASRFAQINDLFDRTPAPAPPFLLQLYVSSLAKRGMEKAGAKVLEDYESKAALIRDAVVGLFYLNLTDAATLIGEHFLEKTVLNAGQRREIEDILLTVAEKSKDKKRLQKFYSQRFLISGNFDVLEKLKLAVGEKWATVLPKLASELKKSGNRKLLASLFAHENEVKMLEELLASDDDPEMLRRYEDLFLKENRGFLKNRYIELATEHLTEHFGRQASSHVREMLSGLMQKREMELAKEICAELTKTFEDRASLAEELNELFPKLRKRPFL